MSVTHHATIRNTLVNVVLTAIDADAGAGNLEFRTSVDAEVATLPLADPAGTVGGAILTFDTTPDLEDADATGGTIDRFSLEDNTGDEIFYGSVGTSGEDINLSSLVVAAGDTVKVSSLTYTAPV